MIALRQSKDRGFADRGWLRSFHTFSFAEYHDPRFMGFHDLRVINEDFIAPEQGFPTHPHKDMEIVTYVVRGELAHRDTLGNSTVIRPGEVQRMSAGAGIRHSEFNNLKDITAHILQIWILPEQKGLSPSYAQKDFSAEFSNRELVLAVSRAGREGSISIHQDVDLHVAKWSGARSFSISARAARKYWLQVVSGELNFNHLKMGPGDGAAVAEETSLKVVSRGPVEFLLFDLP